MVAMHDKIPDWLLERLAAGELPQPQAVELREQIGRASCRERV